VADLLLLLADNVQFANLWEHLSVPLIVNCRFLLYAFIVVGEIVKCIYLYWLGKSVLFCGPCKQHLGCGIMLILNGQDTKCCIKCLPGISCTKYYLCRLFSQNFLLCNIYS
jgi:hypothetical protein